MAGPAPSDVAAARVGARTLLGVSLFWIALSFLSDGLVTLVLPAQLAARGTASPQVLGLVGFLGLLAGMLIQPIAGAVSDRLRPNTGRTPVLLVGTAGVAVALALLAGARSAAAVAASFALVHVGAAVA
jgi:MFS family permease